VPDLFELGLLCFPEPAFDFLDAFIENSPPYGTGTNWTSLLLS
jgi:hypothetical protein